MQILADTHIVQGMAVGSNSSSSSGRLRGVGNVVRQSLITQVILPLRGESPPALSAGGRELRLGALTNTLLRDSAEVAEKVTERAPSRTMAFTSETTRSNNEGSKQNKGATQGGKRKKNLDAIGVEHFVASRRYLYGLTAKGHEAERELRPITVSTVEEEERFGGRDGVMMGP